MGCNTKKLKLNNKLILSLILLIVVVILSIGVSINSVFKKKFDQYIIKNNEYDISFILESIEEEYLNNNWNIKGIEKIGKLAIDKGVFIDLYDQDNCLVWGAMKYNESMCHMVMGSIENNMMYGTNNSRGNYSEEVFEMKNSNNEYIGSIVIGSYGSLYYMDDDIDFLKDINRIITTIGILMCLITVVIAVLISKKITKPIEVVSDMANSIGDGSYHTKIDYVSNISEIDVLIKSINNLSSKLKEQEDLRKRLTTDISHELRTPLTNIQTHIEAMVDGIWSPTTERLNSVNEEVIRLTSLVSQLQNLSKLDSEKAKLDIKEFKIDDLIRSIVYNHEGKALEKNIDIKCDLENINVYLDKDKISQVIVNLLSNAIRYTNSSGEINIKLYKENNSIKIHLHDNGIGIPKECLDNIFERFYRVDESRSKDTGGIGVGLTITKSIIDLHKGNIEVKSQINNGSEFILTLPIKIDINDHI